MYLALVHEFGARLHILWVRKVRIVFFFGILGAAMILLVHSHFCGPRCPESVVLLALNRALVCVDAMRGLVGATRRLWQNS